MPGQGRWSEKPGNVPKRDASLSKDAKMPRDAVHHPHGSPRLCTRAGEGVMNLNLTRTGFKCHYAGILSPTPSSEENPGLLLKPV